jgi:hypothetical protein
MNSTHPPQTHTYPRVWDWIQDFILLEARTPARGYTHSLQEGFLDSYLADLDKGDKLNFSLEYLR